uniref:Endonuclease/exonuclease/phosphatase domain-containing protein n=1 Tax=Quercus lobata TaxID=97700 RepID=A0A7N2LBZ8_QUELO
MEDLSMLWKKLSLTEEEENEYCGQTFETTRVDSFPKNHIDAIVNGGTTEAWRFTGFYEEPDASHREEAWSMLRLLHSKPHLPWCCMGDFNELLHTEEKRGGRLRPHAQMQAFCEALDFCGFLDLGFTGPEFTWHGRRHEYMIWERLDRGMANYDWMSKFLVATVRHLHYYSSDHQPICLILNPNNEAQRWIRKPFWFEKMWLADKGCGNMVLRAWQVENHGTPMFKVTQKLKKCKKMLKSWSREHFGNVKNQIKKKKEELWKAEELAANEGSYDLVVSLKHELNFLLEKESPMWRQRARM